MHVCVCENPDKYNVLQHRFTTSNYDFIPFDDSLCSAHPFLVRVFLRGSFGTGKSVTNTTSNVARAY